MASLFQLRRGTTAEKPTLAAGEMYVNTTSQSLQVGIDGATEVTLVKLNSVNSGSLNVSGDITLGGTIIIGDSTSDNVVFNADLSSSIIPNDNNTYDLGSPTKVYRNVYATSITGAIAATNGIISSSSQITGFETTGRSIVSSSTQITPLLPIGVISGSSQLSGTTIATLTITNLTTVNETASVVFSSGSNTFGDAGNDIHRFTGSVQISGSQTVTGSITATSFIGAISASNGVVSGSSQVVGILSSLNTYTGSNDTTNTTQNNRLINLETTSASVNSSVTNLNSTTASAGIRLTNLETTSASVNSSITNINSFTSSNANTSLNTYTASATIRLTNLETTSASIESRFTTLNTYTTSVDQKFLTIAGQSGSWTGGGAPITSLNSYTASISPWTASVDQKFLTIAGQSGSWTGGGAPITSLNNFTASLNAWSSSVATTGSNTFVGSQTITGPLSATAGITGSIAATNNVVSGSSQVTYTGLSGIPANIISGAAQITPLLPIGVVSGSSQVIGSSITTNTVSFNGTSVALGSTGTILNLVSGSSQITYTGLSGIPANIISGAAQITPLLPIGTVSGSSQITGFEVVASTSHTLISGSSQVSYTGLSSIPANIISGAAQITPLLPIGTLSSSVQVLGGTNIHSASAGDYQFNSIGVGTAGSTVAGEIRATADITAYYSSDIRLKENIQSIPNALDKVTQISGNTYDWKAGFESIHSHTGHDVGVIAQEIEKVLPEVVTDRETGYKAVQYEKIVPLLIEAIKELSAKVNHLEDKLNKQSE